MKANLIIYFDYDNKPDDDKEQEVTELLMSLGEFCENTAFDFQTIPRIGEYIDAKSILKKWIMDDDYKKLFPGVKSFNKTYKALRTGSFMVEEVYHSFKSCTIHCSDIKYPAY